MDMMQDTLAPLRFARRRPVHRRPGRLALAAATAATGLLLVGGVAYGGSTNPGVRLTVHAGDTLWGLAAAHYPGDSIQERVAEIEATNHLTGATIEPGETLNLPAP